MGAPAKSAFKYLAIAFLCLGVAFAAIAAGASAQRLTYGLIALTNLCVGLVFYMRHRADAGAQREDGQT